MDLFIDPTLQFEKVSMETALPEDPNAWAQEILQQLYVQLPFISDFDPHVMMDKVDGERGYGFGRVEVVNKSDIQSSAPQDAVQAAGIRTARIPIIINNRKLQPFDVFITEDGKTVPMTETRLRQAVFRPQAFDVTSKSPGDQSMISQLYPPFRQNFGGGGGVATSVGMGKEGSVLDAILPTIRPSDHARFMHALEDKAVQASYIHNAHSTCDALQKLASFEPAPIGKMAGVLLDHIRPSVVQITKAEHGYLLKTASHRMWFPLQQQIDRGELVRRFGEKIALAADTSGGVALSDAEEPGESEALEEHAPAELIKDFGVYKVQDNSGRCLLGYVFPNLLDIDGTKLPIALFTNGSQAAVQGEIYGTRVGDAVPMHEGRPRGKGVFFTIEDEAQATTVLEIHGAFTQDDSGAALMAETMDGRQVQLRVQPNIDQMTEVDGAVLVPERYQWLSLEGAEDVVLVGPEGQEAEASAKEAATTVTIRGDGVSFSLEGLVLSKLAEEQKSHLTFDDAAFLLAGAGVGLGTATQKLAEASSGYRPVHVRVSRFIETAETAGDEARGHAKEALARMSFTQHYLFKEAAVIPDPTAVDTVLSLGFINPDNLMAFTASMPQIENAQQRMCELLLAARLGIKELPVAALERAVQTTEQVLEGLRTLAFQKN